MEQAEKVDDEKSTETLDLLCGLIHFIICLCSINSAVIKSVELCFVETQDCISTNGLTPTNSPLHFLLFLFSVWWHFPSITEQLCDAWTISPN